MAFENFGLNPLLLKAISASGYTDPTAVQAQAIPPVIEGNDLMVSSSTGSGKTAAFMLPALHKLSNPSAVRGIGPRIIVLTPTRELALQVTKAAETYGRFLKRIKVVSVVGGMPYASQLKQLKQPVEVLVATPGRLLDHMQQGRIDFSRLEILVLDEADRMLDMGFIDDIQTIVQAMPKQRQTLMFSATFDGAVGKLAMQLMRNPQAITVTSHRTRHENIEQRLHYADNTQHKLKLLDELLRDTSIEQAIIFTSTKRDADLLADDLSDQGFAAAALHGDMKQGQRNRTLNNMRRGNIRVLVATDVAARGIDVPTISHVINYDLPRQAEDYIHRIGRTGRAGKQGIAITLANIQERFEVRRIERYTTQTIPVHTLAGLEPKTTFKEERSGKNNRLKQHKKTPAKSFNSHTTRNTRKSTPKSYAHSTDLSPIIHNKNPYSIAQSLMENTSREPRQLYKPDNKQFSEPRKKTIDKAHLNFTKDKPNQKFAPTRQDKSARSTNYSNPNKNAGRFNQGSIQKQKSTQKHRTGIQLG